MAQPHLEPATGGHPLMIDLFLYCLTGFFYWISKISVTEVMQIVFAILSIVSLICTIKLNIMRMREIKRQRREKDDE